MRISRRIAAAVAVLALAFTGVLVASPASADTGASDTTNITHDI